MTDSRPRENRALATEVEALEAVGEDRREIKRVEPV